MSRRIMLLVGLAAGALLLAACSNSSSNERTTTGHLPEVTVRLRSRISLSARMTSPFPSVTRSPGG